MILLLLNEDIQVLRLVQLCRSTILLLPCFSLVQMPQPSLYICFLCVVGFVTTELYVHQERVIHSIKELWYFTREQGFIIYTCIVMIVFAALDILSNMFGNEILSILIFLVQANLFIIDNATQKEREAIVLVLGAIGEGVLSVGHFLTSSILLFRVLDIKKDMSSLTMFLLVFCEVYWILTSECKRLLVQLLQ